MKSERISLRISLGYQEEGNFSIFPFVINLHFFLSSNNTRDTAIEVKTQPLEKNGTNGFLQCIARSKRSDVIQNMSNTYIINVDGK